MTLHDVEYGNGIDDEVFQKSSAGRESVLGCSFFGDARHFQTYLTTDS